MLYQVILLQTGGQGFPMSTVFFMGAMFAVMYFFMIRPQQKKANEQKDFLKQLKKGDRVVTIGGVHGRIVKDNDDTLLIEVDTNTKLKVERSAISLENTKRVNTEDNKEVKDTKKEIAANTADAIVKQ